MAILYWKVVGTGRHLSSPVRERNRSFVCYINELFILFFSFSFFFAFLLLEWLWDWPLGEAISDAEISAKLEASRMATFKALFFLCVCVCVCVLFLFNRRVKLHTDRPPAAASPTGNLGCGTLEAKEPTAESHIEDGLFNGGGRKTVCWTGIENCALVGLLFPFKYPAVRVDDICKQWRLTRRPVCFT